MTKEVHNAAANGFFSETAATRGASRMTAELPPF
jgi:ribosomal protein S20